MDMRLILRRLVSLLFPDVATRGMAEWPILGRAFVALSMAGVFQLFFPTLASQLVDGTLRQWMGGGVSEGTLSRSGDEAWTGLLLLGTVTAIVFCHYLDMKWFTVAGELIAARLRTRVFHRLSALPMSWFSRRTTGELSSLMLSDIAVTQEYFLNDVRQLLRYSMLVVGSLMMMFVTSPRLAMMLLLLVPPAVVAGIILGRRIRAVAEASQSEMGRTSTILGEVVMGIQNVKAFGMEVFERERFGRSSDAYVKQAVKGAGPRSLFVSIIVFLSLVAGVFFMWYGSRQVHLGRLSPGEFTQFMFYLAFAGSGAGSMAHYLTRRQRMGGAADRLEEFFTESVEQGDLGQPGGKPVKGFVEFEHVHFAYPSRPGKPVLRGVSFQANPGETIALAGFSGAGKSTIANLVLRFFEPDAGAVRLDGVSLAELPLAWLRLQIGLVPQEVLLYGDTIAANIAYGSQNASLEAVKMAARRAHADEFISQMAMGYDTVLLDRGTQLSGGQRQRLALARAILRDPAVLILDEATSSLDSESERLIGLALREFSENRTTIVIAHRYASLKAASRIVLLKEGLVEGIGSHEELRRSSPYYGQLFASQWDA